MLNQLSTRQWPLPGYPGDFPFFGPMVVNPVILKTSNSALNVPGVALTYQSGSTTNAVAGGTGVFAGILSNKNTQPYDGNLPTGPVLNIPNDTPTFATSLSTGVYATLSTTARVGDGVAFNTSTGVLAAAPGGVVPNGHTVIPGAVIFRQNVDAAGTVGIVQMLSYVTPVAAPASAILYPEKIASMLAAIKNSGTQRVAIADHSMSIRMGAGSNGTTALDWNDTAFSTLSLIPRASAAINAQYGGSFARGIEVPSSLAGTNPFFTLGGGATILGKQAAASGTCGQAVSLVGGGTGTYAFTINGGVAGQKVRVYGYTTGGVGGVIPRYSMSGANTQATAALPASTTANPVPGITYYWYSTDITLTNAGNTTITLLAPSAAGQSFVVGAVDPDYKTTPGLTIHRASQAGETVATVIGASIDNTDTQPAVAGGQWIGSTAGNAAFRSAQTDSLTTRLGVVGVFAGTPVNDILTYANNAGAYGYLWTLADHKRHLKNYVDAMAARSLPVLFVLDIIRNPATTAVVSPQSTPYTQSDIIAIYKEVAAESTNCAVLDLFELLYPTGTEAQRYAAQVADTSRWLAAEATGTGYAPAYVHPGPTGHTLYGNTLAAQIIAAAN